MKIPTSSRVSRTLKNVLRFTKAITIEESDLGPILGHYENSDDGSDRLLICDQGIYWLSSLGEIRLPFSEIETVELEDEGTSTALVLHMSTNEFIRLPVKGTDGRFFDSLQIYRFLMRVLSDIKS